MLGPPRSRKQRKLNTDKTAVSGADREFTAGGYSFTVLDSENQTGSLQDFMFRRYSPVQGRWISPDPAGLAAVDPSNPQTWNRYAYVMNNPLSFVDPSGLFGDCPSGSGVGTVNPDGTTSCSAPPDISGVDCSIFACGPHTPQPYQLLNLLSEIQYVMPQLANAANNGSSTPTKQQCLQQAYNTPEGNFVQLFSPLSAVPGWNSDWEGNLSEWGIAIFGKGGGLAGSGFSKATQTVQTLSGTTSVATGWFEKTATSLLGLGEELFPFALGGAVLGDLSIHFQCSVFGNTNGIPVGMGQPK